MADYEIQILSSASPNNDDVQFLGSYNPMEPPRIENSIKDDIIITPNLNDSDLVNAHELDINQINFEGLVLESEDEAFHLYNDYAYRMGFSCRKSKVRRSIASGQMIMRQFCCWKEGHKAEKDKGVMEKSHTKIDFRTGCKAMIQFNVDKQGVFTVTKHQIEHNHEPCPTKQRHYLPSHRMMTKNQVNYVQNLVSSGVGYADAVRCLRKEAGGSPCLPFTLKDVYNKISYLKKEGLDYKDANALIEIFKKRQQNEKDFFFNYQMDEFGRLANFFWRDERMKKDYLLFGDFISHDTTYRTNKYAMICAPFVGMNHHCKNVMFGCGFLLNEKTESFLWLFRTFLRSMDNIHPQTIMTDQAFSMAKAIKDVFPGATHRLCLWHIMKNSKTNIPHIRMKLGFVDLFNHVLKGCSTIEEFDYYWNMMITQYECGTNNWIQRLYNTRDRWCPAFSKETFSGGVLSSQRSESTNNVVSSRMRSTSILCDFYDIFCQVVSEWRSKENGEDYRCWNGESEMIYQQNAILKHASSVYTIEIYRKFEQEFRKCTAARQEITHNDDTLVAYKVWGPNEKFFHLVATESRNDTITCTCKKYTEVGILCCHILRIMHISCLDVIPTRYILKRWTKNIRPKTEEEKLVAAGGNACPSVWRTKMIRNFNVLASGSELNAKARKILEDFMKNARQAVVAEVESLYFSDSEEEGNTGTHEERVENPQNKRKKGQKNVRPKSIREKMCNAARGRHKRQQTMSMAVATTRNEEVQG